MLVISPHPDDETFGCGGMIARAVREGARVSVQVISAPQSLVQYAAGGAVDGSTRLEEFRRAMECLGVSQYDVAFTSNDVHMRLDQYPQRDLIGLIEREAVYSLDRVGPDILCIPAPSFNQDHRAVFDACVAACRPHLPNVKPFCPTVLVYEQPQSFWGVKPMVTSVFVDISSSLPTKLQALNCYRSQLQPDPHHASLDAVERLARVRGAEICVTAAEAYRCLRWVV